MMIPMLAVKDVMVDKVVTIQSDETAQLAARVMGEHDIGCLVVLEDSRVLGIVTERDLLNRVLAVAADPEKTLVKQVMSTPVVTVGPDTDLEAAVEMMFKQRIKKLPVVEEREEKRVLVGLVTLTDIARLHPALIKTLRKFFEMIGEPPPKSMEKVMNYYVV
jgi:CBS-domain-containing membrane protein